MNTISPVNYNVYNKISKLKNENSSVIDNPVQDVHDDEFKPSIAFQGAKLKTPASGKRAGLGALFSAAIATLGFSKKANQPVEPTLLDKAREENPELTNALLSQTVEKRYGFEDKLVRVYSDASIYSIVNYNKEDPKFAYQLAKVLSNFGLSGEKVIDTPEKVDYIAQKLKDAPEIVTKYSDMRFALDLLRAHDKNSDLTERLYAKGYDAENITGYVELNTKYPDVVEGLSNNPDMKFSANAAENLAPRYDEDKDLINELAKCLKSIRYKGPETVSSLLDLYKENPEILKKVLLNSKDYRAGELATIFRAEVDTPNIFILAQNTNDGYGFNGLPRKKFSTPFDAAKYAIERKELESQICREEVKVLHHSYKMELLDAFKSEPQILKRIIDDGRIYNAIDFAQIYRENPDKEITQDLIDLYNDPIRKYFG